MKKTITLLVIAVMALAISGAAQAKQTFVLNFTLDEVGSNVVGTVSGSLNTNALSKVLDTSASSLVAASMGILAVVPANFSMSCWGGLFGTGTAFGTGAMNVADAVIGGGAGVNFTQKNVYVSRSYVSGSTISGTATWNNMSFESLFVTPGTYTMTYNGGADSVVLKATAGGSPVPEPGTILAALSILGPAGMMFRRRKA